MFQLFSHKALYSDEHLIKSTKYAPRKEGGNIFQRFPHGLADSTAPLKSAEAPAAVAVPAADNVALGSGGVPAGPVGNNLTDTEAQTAVEEEPEEKPTN